MTTHAANAPAWFRYGVIAVALLILCSCRSTESGPKYRVAADHPPEPKVNVAAYQAAQQKGAQKNADASLLAVQPALATAPAKQQSNIQLASHEIPTHLTQEQLDQGACLPEGFCPTCPTGCACCGPGAIRGPNDEYLCDGGDFGLPAGVKHDMSITGLESEDTIAHYDTIDGRTIVTPSNKVCLYAPRFAVVRQVVDARADLNVAGPDAALQQVGPVLADKPLPPGVTLAGIEPTIHRAQQPPSLLRERQNPGELENPQRPGATIGSIAPYANVQLIRTGEIVGVDIPLIARSSLAAVTWAGDQAPQVLIDNRQAIAAVSVKSPGTIYHLFEPNNPKLRLCKLASTGAALPGEEVEFTLRFDNIGDRVIGNVTIVDHLTTRLEYVPDSQKSTVKANFSSASNEGESLTLRWELIEPLQPREGGVIQFRCRVR